MSEENTNIVDGMLTTNTPPDNYMVSVDFGGRELPIWKYRDLFFVTFKPTIIKEILAGKFDYPNLTPGLDWISGGTPDIAISAATYNATLTMIEDLKKSNKVSITNVKELAEKAARDAQSARDSGPFYDGHIAGGYYGHHR